MNIKNIIMLYDIIKNSLESLQLTDTKNEFKCMNIIELGAGFGLPSIVMIQLLELYSMNQVQFLKNNNDDNNFNTNFQTKINFYITDHDHSTLRRAEENYNATMDYLTRKKYSSTEKNVKNLNNDSTSFIKFMKPSCLNVLFYFLPCGEKESVNTLIQEVSVQP